MKFNLNLIVFVLMFILFAWDMEHTRTFMTWVYLGVGIINLCICLSFWTAAMILGALEHYFKDDKNG